MLGIWMAITFAEEKLQKIKAQNKRVEVQVYLTGVLDQLLFSAAKR